MKTSFYTWIICLISLPLMAQQRAATLTEANKEKVIERIAALLDSNYVFPDKAKAMGEHLRQQYRKKAYAQADNYRSLAGLLSADLQQAHRDPHLNLKYNPELAAMVRQWKAASEPSQEMLKEQLRMAERNNFGFVKVERLPGNIGYIDFRQFAPVSELSRQTVAAAMAFIAGTDAVILDLRQNGGGHAEMVQLVISYFFDAQPIHYNSIYNRPRNETKEYYTLAEVPGKRMPAVDLYVLTSSKTFSAAEELTYNLQSLKRATIVGETTAGGAHPVQHYVVNDQLVLDIPVARAINAVTQTNWEGTGITPDVKTEASKALLKAQELALNKLLTTNPDKQEQAFLAWELEHIKSELEPVQLDRKLQTRYAGRYGERTIRVQGDHLYYQPRSGVEKRLIPISTTLFRVADQPLLRVELVPDASGKVHKLLELHANGGFSEFTRTN